MSLPKQVVENERIANEKLSESQPLDDEFVNPDENHEEPDESTLVDDQNTDGENVPIEKEMPESDDNVSVDSPPVAEEPTDSLVSSNESNDDLNDMRKEVARLSQAYSVLQGKYDAEVPRMAYENKMLRDEILSQKNDSDEEKAPGIPEHLQGLSDDWDEDTLKMMDSVAEARDKKMREELRMEYERRFQEQSQISMMDRVKAKIPNFESLNEDQKFINWLDKRDEFGRNLNDPLQEAWQDGDVDTVLKICERYKRGDTSSISGEIVQPTRSSRQVAPRKTHGAISGSSEKRRYSGAEYAKLMENITLGRLPKNKAEALEKELNQALVEKRIDL